MLELSKDLPVHVSVETIIVRNQLIQSLFLFPPIQLFVCVSTFLGLWILTSTFRYTGAGVLSGWVGGLVGEKCEYDPDMEFVQNFTPPEFQAKNFTPSISPNLNSFSKRKHKKWVKMEKFTPLAKILHCRQHWRHGKIPPLVLVWYVWFGRFGL